MIPNLAEVSCSSASSTGSEVESVTELKHMMSSDGPTPIGVLDETTGEIVSAHKFIRKASSGGARFKRNIANKRASSQSVNRGNNKSVVIRHEVKLVDPFSKRNMENILNRNIVKKETSDAAI
jgi:hypothetical protein